jgi:hypothetical protein
MKEIPMRRITVMSSVIEISTDQLGNRAVVVGETLLNMVVNGYDEVWVDHDL